MMLHLPRYKVLSEIEEGLNHWEVEFGLILSAKFAPLQNGKELAEALIKGVRGDIMGRIAAEMNSLPERCDFTDG